MIESDADIDADGKLDELDRLLNDPDSKMEAARVWTLLAEISQQQAAVAASDKLAAQARSVPA